MFKILILMFVFLHLNCNAQTGNKEIKPSISYTELKEQTKHKRTEFKKQYETIKPESQKDSLINEVQSYLEDIADSYFIAWYNTPWTFSGHTTTPGSGSVACGYFVTTTLSDMGFNIPRVYWAQQTSEYMIKKLTTDIKRFHGKQMSEVESYIKDKGEGLYVVGLDCHVGYIYYKNGDIRFIHSNYYHPKIGVMSEPILGRNPLNDSKYRVIGKIFDKKMALNWILEAKYSK